MFLTRPTLGLARNFRTATLERPGPFAVKGVRAPSTESFVSNKNRKKVEAKIQELGEDYGCHKCGTGHPFYQRFYHFFCGEFKRLITIPIALASTAVGESRL